MRGKGFLQSVELMPANRMIVQAVSVESTSCIALNTIVISPDGGEVIVLNTS